MVLVFLYSRTPLTSINNLLNLIVGDGHVCLRFATRINTVITPELNTLNRQLTYLSIANRSKGEWIELSFSELGELASTYPQQAHRTVKYLIDIGLIQKQGSQESGHPNRYRSIPIEEINYE